MTDIVARLREPRGIITPQMMLFYKEAADEIDRLRTALEPFILELDGYKDSVPDYATIQDPGITVGDLRRARDAVR